MRSVLLVDACGYAQPPARVRSNRSALPFARAVEADELVLGAHGGGGIALRLIRHPPSGQSAQTRAGHYGRRSHGAGTIPIGTPATPRSTGHRLISPGLNLVARTCASTGTLAARCPPHRHPQGHRLRPGPHRRRRHHVVRAVQAAVHLVTARRGPEYLTRRRRGRMRDCSRPGRCPAGRPHDHRRSRSSPLTHRRSRSFHAHTAHSGGRPATPRSTREHVHTDRWPSVWSR